MILPPYDGTCPHCGNKDYFYIKAGNSWRYGSPIRQCGECGRLFIDDRYHEIAVEGYKPDTLSVSKSVGQILIGIAIALVASFIHYLEVRDGGSFYVIFPCLAVSGIFMVLVGAVDIILIKSGIRERKLQKLRRESEERLQNPQYANDLKDSGYAVPKKYLDN